MGRSMFIDLLNYFHSKLSTSSKTFRLNETLKKRYLPHPSTSQKTLNYIGKFSAPEYYGLDSISTSKREEFLLWYEKQRGCVFKMKSELIEYTISDVKILRLCCMTFRKMMIDIGNTDPFLEGCTIASACSRPYRKNFLEKDAIGIVPPQGYRRADRHSQEAISWLLYRSREDNRHIIHAGMAREYRLQDGTKVDGFS